MPAPPIPTRCTARTAPRSTLAATSTPYLARRWVMPRAGHFGVGAAVLSAAGRRRGALLAATGRSAPRVARSGAGTGPARETLSSSPTTASETTSDDPPELRNGSVMPVYGIALVA